jgi:hypothetical protein
MNAHLNRLPQMREDLKRLEEKVEELQRRRGDTETRGHGDA